ncbi:MAG: TcpQ domain-containing protein [Bdellovibrionales bacterium]
MIGVQTLIRRKTLLTVTACIVVGFSATHAIAGFEWIPQKQAVEPPPPPVPVQVLPSDNIILPLPADAELQEPVIMQQAPPPIAVIPEPVVVVQPPPPAPILPMIEPEPMPAPPARIAVVPREMPNTGVVVVPPPAAFNTLPPLAPPQPILAPPPPMGAVVIESPETLKRPPFEMGKTRIVVPDDAPAGAVAHAEKKNAQIVAYPDESSLRATQEPPVAFVTRATPTQTFVEPITNAVGFADDVPLALALRQVVPADYAFSFGANVNPGLRVSWNGGRPWNEVVADMVTTLGYGVIVRGKTVLVVENNQAMAPNLAPMPALIEPAAGNASSDAVENMVPAERQRKIKRINITDPGSQNTHKGTLVEKVTSIFETNSDNSLSFSDNAQANASQPSSLVNNAPQKVSFWTAEAGASLRETLLDWSKNAGVELEWDATHDYQLTSDFEVQGNFDKAVSLLIKHGAGASQAKLGHSTVMTPNRTTKVVIGDQA